MALNTETPPHVRVFGTPRKAQTHKFVASKGTPNPTHLNMEAAAVARAGTPSPLQARTQWTVTQLPAQRAPAQRSTKTHGKTGHFRPGAKHHYFRQVQHQNPIG